MTDTALYTPTTRRPGLEALFALAVCALLAAGIAVGSGSNPPSSLVTTTLAPAAAQDAPPAETGLDVADAPAAGPALAPAADTPRRPARRHRQPLSMPFFSFARS